ncbi:hypothetical protein Tco_0993607 [Tanacetum coccineum]
MRQWSTVSSTASQKGQEDEAILIPLETSHGKTVITHSLTVGSSRNFERRKEGFWIRLCKGNNESRMVQTELYADVRITWIVNGAAFAVRSSIVISKGFKFVLPSFVILIDISRVLSRIKDVSSFLGRYCARILKVLVEAKSSTAEVYESTAHSLFKEQEDGYLRIEGLWWLLLEIAEMRH